MMMASSALLCELLDGGSHTIQLKTGKDVKIENGRLFVSEAMNFSASHIVVSLNSQEPLKYRSCMV